MKEAFEKGLKFMSRLDNSNMVCMAGICYVNTPLLSWSTWKRSEFSTRTSKFKVVTSTKSELQRKDQITAGILVHMVMQIASALKYLASCNFVWQHETAWLAQIPGEDRQILVQMKSRAWVASCWQNQLIACLKCLHSGHTKSPSQWATLMNCYSSKCSLSFAVVSDYSTNSL